MNRNPLMTLPAENSPLIDLFRVVTEITTRSPGEVIRDILYGIEANTQAHAFLSTTAGPTAGTRTGSVVIRTAPGGASPLTPFLSALNAICVPGSLTVGMDTLTEADRGDLLAVGGIQVFRRSGPDGKTMTFEAFGRTIADALGGIDELAAVVDARQPARRNVGSMVDAILDAGDEGILVIVDGDPTRNPLGLVVAVDGNAYLDELLGTNFTGTTGVTSGDFATFSALSGASTGSGDPAEELVYVFAALPASSTNAANYQ